MVSDYSDAGQEQWLADNGIDLLRGTGRLAGPGAVEVDGVRHTAEHVVLANGADPVVPPIPGLRELEGVWTNREATGMKAVPRRLLILGGGPVGVEMAQAVRRLGGEVVIVDGAEHVLAPRAGAAGRGARRGPARRRHRAGPRRERRAPPDATATTTCSSSTTVASCAATGCSSPPAGGRGSTGSASRPSASSPMPTGSRSTRTCGRREALGDRRRRRDLAADPHRQVPGRGRRRRTSSASRGEADYEAVPRVVYTDPQAAAVGATDGRFSGTAPLAEVPKTATYTRAYAESNGFLTLLSDGERLTGAYALGPEAGEWLQQATLAIRAHVPLDVLRDTIQPFPTFSEIYVGALKALRAEIAAAPGPVGAAGHGDRDEHEPPSAELPRADGRRDRRQRRHRPRDRPARPRRGRRGRPHRPQSRAARASGAARSTRRSTAAFDATDCDAR